MKLSENLTKISEFFATRDKFLILTHEKPDGDAVGSLTGLLKVLRENGKMADAFLPDPIPERYHFLLTEDFITGQLPKNLSRYESLVCLDFTSFDRTGLAKENIERISSLPVSINVDHHPDNKLFASENFVCLEAAATAEILFRAFNNKKGAWRISPGAAEAFMVGILMDTGCFRFANTSPSVFNTASALLKCGIDYQKLINNLFFSKSLKLIQLESELVLQHLKTSFSGRFAWFYMSDKLLEDHKLNKKDTEDIIECLRAVKGVEIAAVIYKKKDGFKFSLRSKNAAYSVGRVARKLNGGGHEMAAAGFIKSENVNEVENMLLKEIKELLK